MKNLHAYTIIVMTFPGLALAGDLQTCSHSHTEDEMSQCVAQLNAADSAEIHKLTTQIEKGAESSGYAKALDKASHAWENYRNAECTARTYESREGSGYQTIYGACLSELNALRISDLKKQLSEP